MNIKRNYTWFISITIIVLFYIFTFIYNDHNLYRGLTASIFPILTGGISGIWLIQAYRSKRDDRYFWLLLSIGFLFYTISNSVWFYNQLTTDMVSMPVLSTFLWLSAYLFFLIGLVYKTRKMSLEIGKVSYVFNIIIFMIIAISIITYYLIQPIWEISGHPIMQTFINMIFPLIDLSILLVITTLYYLAHHSKERILVTLIVFGFFLQVVADLQYAYQLMNNTYQAGGYLEPLWVIGLLMVGIAGNYAKNNYGIKQEMKESLLKKESVFPYISLLLLALLVVQSYGWNFNILSAGLAIVFVLFLVRQLLILQENEKLVGEFRYLAYHDPLTGLGNRVKFIKELQSLIKISKKSGEKIAVLLIDLDRFKNINDTLGHQIGDRLLKVTSKRLLSYSSENGYIYRVGGDEFIIVLPGASEDYCKETARIVLASFQKPFVVGEYEISITPSIGVSMFPNNGLDSETLLKNADAAMYYAKEQGKNNYQFYTSNLNGRVTRKMLIENGLQKAISNNELKLVYQPKLNLKTRKVIGMEALLRWENADLGFVSPGEFIPVAEETGQIIPIGRWVLQKACEQNKAWQDAGYNPLCISVNVSVRQFQNSDFVNNVKKVLQQTGLDPKYLELEITESVIQNIDESTEVLKQLKSLGVSTSIDDFGTGYSSLHVLKRLPIDTLKIDKYFIDDIEEFKEDSMVKSIIDLGLNMRLSVVAEGIEEETQATMLEEFRCDYGQGYLFSKPLSAKDFEEYITSIGSSA